MAANEIVQVKIPPFAGGIKGLGGFSVNPAFLVCAPGEAHPLEGESRFRTLMAGIVSRTARAAVLPITLLSCNGI